MFAEDELNLSQHVKLNLGTRFDYSKYRSNFASPRAALIFQPSAQASYKLLYGKAFRNPTQFELFYTDLNAQTVGNPELRPEASNTIELAMERKMGQSVSGTLSVYRYRLDDLVVGEYTAGNLLQYHNRGTVRASGVEMELNTRPARWLQLGGSVSLQRALNVTNDSPLPNSPARLGKLRITVPLFNGRVSLANGNQFVGTRQTLAGARLAAVFMSDIVMNVSRLGPNVDFQAGVRDLGDVKYVSPLALNSRVDTLPSPGRSLFLSLTWAPKRN